MSTTAQPTTAQTDESDATTTLPTTPTPRTRGRTVPAATTGAVSKVFAPYSVPIEIAGRAYTLIELPSRPADEWRKRLAGPFTDLVTLLSGAEGIELNDLSSIGALINTAQQTLLGSIEMIRELVFAYDSELRTDKEWLLNHAYDREFIAVFVEVLKLMYPLQTVVSAFTTGRATNGT